MFICVGCASAGGLIEKNYSFKKDSKDALVIMSVTVNPDAHGFLLKESLHGYYRVGSVWRKRIERGQARSLDFDVGDTKLSQYKLGWYAENENFVADNKFYYVSKIQPGEYDLQYHYVNSKKYQYLGFDKRFDADEMVKEKEYRESPKLKKYSFTVGEGEIIYLGTLQVDLGKTVKAELLGFMRTVITSPIISYLSSSSGIKEASEYLFKNYSNVERQKVRYAYE